MHLLKQNALAGCSSTHKAIKKSFCVLTHEKKNLFINIFQVNKFENAQSLKFYFFLPLLMMIIM
jgi:hypothetical protein